MIISGGYLGVLRTENGFSKVLPNPFFVVMYIHFLSHFKGALILLPGLDNLR